VVTGLIRDRAFRGLSPFLKTRGSPFSRADPIQLPILPFPFSSDIGVPVSRAEIVQWLNDDPDVRELRRRGLWSDLHDRIAQYAVYFRTVEHSAQQPSGGLREYESEFKAGRVNVLSCSTTMEMGVDIGSISTVVMTNVPPSIASYRQRVGRVGRRNQEMALSLTLCKNRAIDRAVFRDPKTFLDESIYAPAVALDSAVIAQRHVNATLLARFLGEERAELHRVRVGPFFGHGEDGSVDADSLSRKFEAWLDDETTRGRADITEDLRTLLNGTPLDGSLGSSIDATREAISRASVNFQGEWEAMWDDLKAIRE
jgi:DEAD/DEAH box helicase domain-containing protein